MRLTQRISLFLRVMSCVNGKSLGLVLQFSLKTIYFESVILKLVHIFKFALFLKLRRSLKIR